MRWGEIIRRLVLIPPTLVGVAVIVFVLLRVVPGDPIAMMIPPGATATDIERLRAFYGLDQPILQQFFTWSGQALSGNFGRSISVHQSVFDMVRARLPATGISIWPTTCFASPRSCRAWRAGPRRAWPRTRRHAKPEHWPVKPQDVLPALRATPDKPRALGPLLR